MSEKTVSIVLGDDSEIDASDTSSSDPATKTETKHSADGTKKRRESRCSTARPRRRQHSNLLSRQLSSVQLGDRIENSASAKFFTQKERLMGVSATLLLSFCFVNGMVYTFNEIVLYQRDLSSGVQGDHWKDKNEENLGVLDEEEDGMDSTSWAMSNSHPLSSLDDEQFLVYVGFVLWVTTILAGLGMELLVLLSFLKQGWSKDMEIRWRFAQFFFSLLAAATFGLAMRQEFFALLTLVPGLWKFGFPETIMYTTVALYKESNGDGTSMSKLHRVADFLNAVGTVVHHGAASLLICMMLSGPVKAERCITDPVLVLLMQHWFVLVQYVSPTLYLVLELLLEVWFEWTLLSNLESIFDNHWTAALAAVTMLVAHWLYLVAAGLEPFRHCGWDKTRRSEHEELLQDSGFLAPSSTSTRRRKQFIRQKVSDVLDRSAKSIRLERSPNKRGFASIIEEDDEEQLEFLYRGHMDSSNTNEPTTRLTGSAFCSPQHQEEISIPAGSF